MRRKEKEENYKGKGRVHQESLNVKQACDSKGQLYRKVKKESSVRLGHNSLRTLMKRSSLCYLLGDFMSFGFLVILNLHLTV